MAVSVTPVGLLPLTAEDLGYLPATQPQWLDTAPAWKMCLNSSRAAGTGVSLDTTCHE